MEEENLQWAYRYAPASINDMVLSTDLRDRFKQMAETGKLQNMTLYGQPGVGKTTLARLLIKAMGERCESVFIPCGIENSVDMVRSKVVDFVDSYCPDKTKICILDEADSLSGTASGTEVNSAQKALRSVMCADDCVFILTCNNLGSLSAAIQSRCTPLKLQFSSEDVLARCVSILRSEEIKFSKDILMEFYDKMLIPAMPDIRSVICNLELWCSHGEMKNVEGTKAQSELEILSDTILKKLMNGVPPREISKFYIENCDSFNSNYEALAGSIFRKVYANPEVQLIIAESLFRMGTVYDKEIEFYTMLLRLGGKIKPVLHG